jgi:hypothetical protein
MNTPLCCQSHSLVLRPCQGVCAVGRPLDSTFTCNMAFVVWWVSVQYGYLAVCSCLSEIKPVQQGHISNTPAAAVHAVCSRAISRAYLRYAKKGCSPMAVEPLSSWPCKLPLEQAYVRMHALSLCTAGGLARLAHPTTVPCHDGVSQPGMPTSKRISMRRASCIRAFNAAA